MPSINRNNPSVVFAAECEVRPDANAYGSLFGPEKSCVRFGIFETSQPGRLKYLKDVIDPVLAGETDYAKLMPDVWKQEHPEAVRVDREEEVGTRRTASR